MDIKIPDGTRNDSDLTNREVEALLASDGVKIEYGDIAIVVQRSALDDARAYVASLDQDERSRSTISVDRDLRKALPKVTRGRIKRKRMDDFLSDLLLWTALREVVAQ